MPAAHRRARRVVWRRYAAGIDLLLEAIPADNVMFASEMAEAVRGIDPKTGNYRDDTERYVDNNPSVSVADKQTIFEGIVRKVFSRLPDSI